MPLPVRTRCHSRGMSETARQRTCVQLPSDVARPFEVFVNGVLQREGTDYVVRDGALVFERPMKEEGKLGLMRWTSIALGIAGSYGQNDSVDVAYVRDGRKVVAAKLRVEPMA
jgi:hypothetical protein